MEQSIHKEIFELELSVIVVLYEIVLKDHGGAKYYFHAGENGYQNTLYYGNGTGANAYHYIPVSAQGFDYTDDTLPRPTISFDNTNSFFSLKTRFFEDFIGYEIRRIRTFVKFLHGKNFPNDINPYGTPTEDSFPTEKYVVNQKTAENSELISFELTSALEKERAFIPNRKIVFNTCQWQYRSSVGCGYNGAPVTDGRGNAISLTLSDKGTFNISTTYNEGDYVKIENTINPNSPPKVYVCLKDNTTGIKPDNGKDKWLEDACPKNIFGCRARFQAEEKDDGLPFGGFPGTWEQ
jgi:lambda family phage minor tail protein L